MLQIDFPNLLPSCSVAMPEEASGAAVRYCLLPITYFRRTHVKQNWYYFVIFVSAIEVI
ncbi:MAG: hypothetical protein QNJ38_02600 [Prochloraceae cyanobacterium]|nr:hypothetical protein [Prochloraceae cyanobacterium]